MGFDRTLIKARAKEIAEYLNAHALQDWNVDAKTVSANTKLYQADIDAAVMGKPPEAKFHEMGPEHSAEASRLAQLIGDLHNEREKTRQEIYDKQAEVSEASKGVADAPYGKTWHELTLKRMLRYAAENDYQQVGWINGEKTKERYDLSKQLDSLGYWTKTGELTGWKDGRKVVSKVVPEDKLGDYVGKEIAERLMSDEGIAKATVMYSQEPGNVSNIPRGEVGRAGADRPWRVYLEDGKLEGAFKTEEDAIARADQVNKLAADSNRRLSGLQLQVGGEWANNLYDRMVPQFLSKYGKKWGAQVGEGEFDTARNARYQGPEYTVEQLEAMLPKDTGAWTVKANEAESDYAGKAMLDVLDQNGNVRATLPENEVADYMRQEQAFSEQKLTEIQGGKKVMASSLIRMINDMKQGMSFDEVVNNEPTTTAQALGGDFVRPLEKYGTIPVTPEMKESVLKEGQPAFSVEGQGQEGLLPSDFKVTKEHLQTNVFKGSKVFDLGGGRYTVETPSGSTFGFRETGYIEIDPAVYQKGYGQSLEGLSPGARALGKYTILGKDAFVSLATGYKVGTIYHEAYHIAEELFLTAAEKASLIKKYGDSPESRAQAYEAWATDKNAAPNTIWQKIKDAFTRMLHLIRPTAESTFKEVQSGRVWERQAREAKEISDLSGGELKLAGEGVGFGVNTFKEDLLNNKELISALAETNGYPAAEYVEQYFKDATNVYRQMLTIPEAQFDWDKSSPFWAVKGNSDFYKWSEDFTTLCKNRAFMTATVDAIQKKIGGFLSKEDLLQVWTMLKAEGYPVECGPCYVSTARGRMGKPGDKFLKEWEKLQLGATYEKDPFWFTARNVTKEQKESGVEKGAYGAIDYINKNGKPDIPLEYFVTSAGNARLAREYPEIYSTFNEKVFGSAKAKAIETSVEYNHEWLNDMVPDGSMKMSTFIAQVNRRGGVRSQSWSDFQMQHLLDKMQAIYDCSLRGAKRHSYTKVVEMVEAFGLTGEKINMSLVPGEGNGIGADGKYTFAEAPMTFPWEDAVRLREMFRENAGTVMLGVSDEHIRMAMADNLIDYIIPYHKSGRSQATLVHFGMKGWQDYTYEQGWKDLREGMKGRKMSLGNAADDQRIPVWDDYAYDGDKPRTPQEAVDKFFEICKEKQLEPPFLRFAGEEGNRDPNYLKFITDTKWMHDGEILPKQKPVEPVFDQETLNRLIKNFTENPSKLVEDAPQDIVNKFLQGRKFGDLEQKAGLPESLAPGKTGLALAKPEQRPEVEEAIKNTEGAEFTPEGRLKLTVVRYQKPWQAGERAVRSGVFYLPESNSPNKKHYSGKSKIYGGEERFEGETEYRNPLIVKAATGGRAPELAYDAVNGKGAYEKMREEVLKVTRPGWVRVSDGKAAEVSRVEELLKKYGGNPNFAYDMVEHSTKGNLLAYAIQEHIVAASLRDAHYDAVIGYGKAKGAPRLSEVFDLREEQFPWRDKWTEKYEDFYEGRPESVGILDPMQIGKFNALEQAAALPESLAPQGYSLESKERKAAYPIGAVKNLEGGAQSVELTHLPEGIAPREAPASVEKSFMAKYLPGYNFAEDVRQGALLRFGPTAKGQEWFRAGVVLGSHLGTMHRAVENTYAKFGLDSKLFDKLGVFRDDIPLMDNLGMLFMSYVSDPKGKTLPKVLIPLQPVIDRIRGAFYDRVERLEKVGAPLDKLREYYFPGMWKKESIRAFNLAMEEAINAGRGGEAREGGVYGQIMDVNAWNPADRAWVKDRTQELLAAGEGSDKSHLAFLTRRPFKGTESFRKAKVFDDIMTGVEFGLEPISNNPIDLVKLKLSELDRSIMANGAIQEWKNSGDIEFLHTSKSVPEGWKAIEDKYGIVYGKYDPVTGTRPIIGRYIAKIPVFDVLNNYLSSSIYNSPAWGKAFKNYMFVGNLLNEVQLGVFSAFHAGFTSVETQITAGANVFKDAYGLMNGTRSAADLVKTLKRYPTAIVRTAMEGGKILSEFNSPSGIDTPTDIAIKFLQTNGEHGIAMVAKAAELAGGGFAMDRGLRTYQTEAMVRDWASGKKLKAMARGPMALIEVSMKPVLEWLVPRQKAGVFGEMVGRIVEMNPDKTLMELRPEFREAWNRVDARLGQVRYDRLFLDNAYKNAIQAIIRAPGWTGGTLTEVGGAPVDAAKFVKEWLDTGKAPKDIPNRVAYTMSLFATVCLANGLMTYLFTGETPKGMDFFAFRSGGKDVHGNENRWLLPTYMKDIFAYFRDWQHTITAKTHPLLALAGDMMKNKTYYGEQITNEDRNWYERWVEDRGLHAVKTFTPFWMAGANKAVERAGGWGQPTGDILERVAPPLVGVMPAPRPYTASDAQKVIDKYNELTRPATTTKETVQAKDIKRRLLEMARDQDEAGFQELATQAIGTGAVTLKAVKELMKESKNPPGLSRFTKLPLEWALKAFGAADEAEQAAWKPYLLKKIQGGKPETIFKHQEKVVDALEKLGLSKAAQAVKGLSISEKYSQLDTTGLGVEKDSPQMADMNSIDDAIAEALEKMTGEKPERKKSMLPRLSHKKKKSPYEALGL
ncbi:hypothetical protein DFAR_3060005 [Desulfarculales bacterium]